MQSTCWTSSKSSSTSRGQLGCFDDHALVVAQDVGFSAALSTKTGSAGEPPRPKDGGRSAVDAPVSALLLVCQRAASARLDSGRPKQSGQAAPDRKEVVGNAVPQQHPAEVLRLHYKQLRALLAIAMIAVVGLTTTVVILANDSDEVADTGAALPAETAGAARDRAAAEAAPGKLAVKTHENAARLLKGRVAAPAAATSVASPGAATAGLESYKDYSKNSASGDALPPSTP